MMIVAAMSVVTAKLIDSPPLGSANDRSRWCTVWSLVERGTYQIDEIRKVPGWDTIDLVKHEGHFYSSKPPLLPYLVSEIYRAIRRLTGWTLTSHTEEITNIILFLINILPMGIALWALYGCIRRHCDNVFGQLFLLTAACWGTLLLPFLTVFNNHTIATTAFIFAIVLAVQIIADGRHHPWRHAACGLFAGWGVCNELPAALLGIALFLLLCWHSCWKRTAMWFVTFSLIPIGGFFITNYHATGGWKPFYMYYGTEKYEFVHEGIPSYWLDPKGVDKPRDTPLEYFTHCTIGHHGILSLTPIYLLTLWSWLLPATWRKRPLRLLFALSVALTLAVLAFYLSRTANYNYGGVSVALRWTLWLTPFWLLSMIPVLEQWGRSLWFRILVTVLLTPSIFSAWYPGNAPWTQPWIYQWMKSAKWIDYSDGRPQFDRKHFSWISELPDGDLQEDYWITFSAVGTDGEFEEIKLQDGGRANARERIITITRTDSDESVRQFVVDMEAFQGGEPVVEFLVRRNDGEPLTDEDREFFSGVSGPSQYFSSRVRFERSRLRRDAFKTHQGYSYVTIKGQNGRTVKQIRDVWYCEDVPFGILKWEDRVIDARTNAVLSRKFWHAADAGKIFATSSDGEE
ncbi:MAG: hypothetical protein KDA80_00195 [Planctomycetaceae bacterium]|nr:hypothetical protein [Planctomycetaceae bacterium]